MVINPLSLRKRVACGACLGEGKMNRCPVCGESELVPILELLQVPIHCNLLWAERSAALRAPRGDIHLTYCEICDHVFNKAFQAERTQYGETYENALDFSPRFQEYIEALAEELIARYELRNMRIIDIGSGQGQFLRLICRLGENRGIGFDPSFIPTDGADERVEFNQVRYNESHTALSADLITARHLLEHLYQPRVFLSLVHEALSHNEGAVLYLEVPNVLYTLRDNGIWDLIYEHPSYYSPRSLGHVLRTGQLEVLDLRERFGGQFLSAEASIPGVIESDRRYPSGEIGEAGGYIPGFAQLYREKTAYWRDRFSQFQAERQETVIWGSGSKGVTFLNAIGRSATIDYAVDINPRKIGKFVAGTGQRIISPDHLRQIQPQNVIVMNPNYLEEIKQSIEGLGLFAKVFLA